MDLLSVLSEYVPDAATIARLCRRFMSYFIAAEAVPVTPKARRRAAFRHSGFTFCQPLSSFAAAGAK